MAIKLTIELVPSSSWGDNLRDGLKIKKGDWERLKRACFEKAGGRCEVCGGVGKRHPLECHERWYYDGGKGVQRLEGLVALCPSCHRAKHIGHTLYVLGGGVAMATLKHIARVNGQSDEQVMEMIVSALVLQQERSRRAWVVDVSALDLDTLTFKG